MKIEKQLTDSAVLNEIGERIVRRRLDLYLAQADLAEQAGLSKRTVERVEAGHSTQIASMIRILRVLDLADNLENLIPEATSRPMELLKLKNKTRKRASPTRKTSTAGGRKWLWGDEK